MARADKMTAAKRRRIIATYGPCPAGYTTSDLESLLDMLYGLFSYVFTSAELRSIIVSDPFDRSETPRCMRLIDLAGWLEALVS